MVIHPSDRSSQQRGPPSAPLVPQVVLQAPVLHQDGTPGRVTVAGGIEGGDPVRTEVVFSVVLFAPGRQQALALEKGQRNGPDHPLGGSPLLIDIRDRKLVLAAQGLADGA